MRKRTPLDLCRAAGVGVIVLGSPTEIVPDFKGATGNMLEAKRETWAKHKPLIECMYGIKPKEGEDA